MARIFVTAMSAVTILLVGIIALTYRQEAVGNAALTGNEAEAYNLTVNVSSDALTIVGNAMPRLLGIAIIVVVIIMLLMISGR